MSELQPHIRLSKEVNSKYAIMPGDPARLDRIAPFLEDVQELTFNREYRSLVGTYKGVRILAISTGMGGAPRPPTASTMAMVKTAAALPQPRAENLLFQIRFMPYFFASGSLFWL